MEMAATQEKQAASSGKNKKSVNDRFEFRWVDRPAEQFSPPRSRHRGYADRQRTPQLKHHEGGKTQKTSQSTEKEKNGKQKRLQKQ